jgi:DnaJ family protein C protein 17
MRATDAEISKAYKKLALQLHPDKQKSGLSLAASEAVAKRFHDIKEARAFLLEAEHQEDRRRYDAKLASERLRKQVDALRERSMSERRKRLRQELKEKEALVARTNKKQKKDKDLVDQLRRDGKQMREAYAERDAQNELESQLKKERKIRTNDLEDRQIRLKWDRKKINISPSEHSIADLLSKFGVVEQVEMIGSKGNQALVTYNDPSSCRSCVDGYATSNEMRAKFVGKRKKREEEEEENQREKDDDHQQTVSSSGRRPERETLDDRCLRQAAEREALLRQMEAEEEEQQQQGGTNSSTRTGTTKTAPRGSSNNNNNNSKSSSKPFPTPFPNTPDFQNLSALQKLERLEQTILGNLITPEHLRSIQITTR